MTQQSGIGGQPRPWEHPYLVFLAEHGRIVASDPGPSTLVLPEPVQKQEFMLEFFAYETVHYLNPSAVY